MKQICSLSGSSRNRRKQLRLLKKKYPDCILKGTTTIKTLNGKRVECEDANVSRTQVWVEN